MSRKMLSEPQAWRKIAVQVSSRRQSFLCLALDGVGRISKDTDDAMHRRLRRHLAGAYTAFERYKLNGDTPADLRRARVLAALWLALEAEDELKALAPKKRPAGPSSLRRPRQHRKGK